MKHLSKFLILFLTTVAIGSCGRLSNTRRSEAGNAGSQNSMYYWRTTFSINPAEEEFLKNHNISRLYVRMFDVATEQNYLDGTVDIVPIATTKFISEIPTHLEIVPVTYITIEALRAMEKKESEFAPLIVERLLAMASYNNCGHIREIQLDCDWTSSTRKSYHTLCELVKAELKEKNIQLSITVRLHQMQETPPPADRGVLMLYNTGALKNPDTYNSILHIENVTPYMRKTTYQIPLDYAYPVFGWGVKFNNNTFVSIVSEEDSIITDKEHIRYERPSVEDVLEVKELVEENFGKPTKGNILYHLDASQLKNYTHNEINEILAY